MPRSAHRPELPPDQLILEAAKIFHDLADESAPAVQTSRLLWRGSWRLPLDARRCSNCQRLCVAGGRWKNRCGACASYWQRHGQERPLVKQRRRETCATCACPCEPGKLTQGRCGACYQYWRRHGAERPPGPLRGVRPATPRVCANCERLCEDRPLSRGRCRSCYEYWRRHGVDRPPLGARASRAPGPPCITCGEAATSPRRGRCAACYMYWYRHGTDTARRLRRDRPDRDTGRHPQRP